MSLDTIFHRHIAEHQQAVKALSDATEAAIMHAAERLSQCFHDGGKAIFLGNGGSAAEAQHLAAEFLGRLQQERSPLPALALHANGSTLTAIANDYGYEQVFARQLSALARPGDVVIGISTSGNSPNIIAALRCARSLICATIAMTGQNGGNLSEFADVLIPVPSHSTLRIQECHILLGHILCDLVEKKIYGS